MKNIFKFACLFLAVAMTSCYDTMDDKAVVEEQFDAVTAPTVATATPEIVDFSTFVANGTVGSLDAVLEVGFQVSADASFSNAELYPAAELATSFSATVGNKKDNTTYYVRSYAFTKDSKMVFAEAATATLPKAPEFADKYLIGTYTAVDFDAQTGAQASNPYTITIEQKDGLWNMVNISNIWEGEMTISATVDFENKTITTTENSVIYEHPDYGDVWAWGLAPDMSAWYAKCISVANYDDQGNMTLGPWAARCSAGVFGYYVTKMVKQ